MLVGAALGGGADIIARSVGQKLGASFQHQVIVDNRAGAGGNIAAELTAKATPDGYTLLMVATSYAVNVGFPQKLSYDLVKDFAPVTLIGSAPNVLVANPSLPANCVTELIGLARAKPGQLNFASSGTISLLAGELLKSMVNINLTHVPDKGASLAFIDVISGQIQLAFSSLPGAPPHIKAGRVKAIAVTSVKRSGSAPDIPTFSESGVAGYEAPIWLCVLAPASTPNQIVSRLNAELLKALRSSDVIAALNRQGVDPLGSTPGDFESYVKSEIAKWTKVIREAGVQPD